MAIDFKPDQNEYKNMTPFKTWLIYQINTWGVNNFPFLENDFDQLTNYGMLMKLMKAVNDNIHNQNLVEDDMTKLYGAFTELQAYINNYFDNLDVQEEINNKLDEMVQDGTLQQIIGEYVLQYYLVDNTMTQEEIQNILNINRTKIIEFKNGNYNFNSTFRLNKNTKLILNNSILTFTEQHAFFNFLSDDEPLEYNGNSNIEIIGGKIIGGSFSLCHAYNITFKNVNFEHCLNSHIIELMSCNNVKIINCRFAGMTDTLSTYREYIQIDDCTYSNFPWFNDKNNPTYDGTHCKNIIVDGCLFERTTNENFVFHTAVGMHTHSEDGLYHENIQLINNTLINPSSHGLRINNTKGIIIKNNNIIITENTYLTIALRFGYYAENVEISNNTIDGGYRGMYFSRNPLKYSNFNIHDNIFKNMTVGNTVPNLTLLVLNNPEEFNLHNNIFENNRRSAIAINGTEIEDNEDPNEDNKATIVISNNIFRDNNYVNKNMIQIYYGNIVYINNNTFDYDTETGGSAILFENNTKGFTMGNVFNSSLVSKSRTINMLTNNNVNDIYNHKINIYSANTSSFNNVTPTNNSIFQFNALDLVIGTTSDTIVVKLKPYSMKGKLTARTYKIPIAITNGEYEFVTFTINNDGTISGSSTSLNIRSIWAYNEIDV